MTRSTLLLICSIFMLAGCAQVAPDAVELGVDFSWKNSDRCSGSSPEITVTNIPEKTQSFEIRLKDLDVPSFDHGGGTIMNDGSGVISSGQLKSGYKGPCPPSGSHVYQFTVNALDGDGVIVGTGKERKKFPPN